MPSTGRFRAATSALTLSAVGLAATVLSPSAEAPATSVRLPIEVALAGSVTPADRGHVVERAFDVPPGTRQLDIAFEHGAIGEAPIQFDLGVRSPDGLRGWSEDHHHDIHIDDTSASYGYLPGPIVAGTWTILIGV